MNVFSNSIFSSRLLAPAFRWISPLTDGDAEDYHPRNGVPSPTFSYSFVYISDDEGKTWKRSLSELFISVNRAAWGLEEPIVVELRDGRLLM
ncbi:MAG: sialidase family protein, partial [Phycisphaeraceae bacterium]|nr:sialidase family protein [Phycisphaeraceae bacterium]